MPIDETYQEPTADEQILRAVDSLNKAIEDNDNFNQHLALDLIDTFSRPEHRRHRGKYPGIPLEIKKPVQQALQSFVSSADIEDDLWRKATKLLRRYYAETVIVNGKTSQAELELWAQNPGLILQIDQQADIARLPAHIAGNLRTSTKKFAPPRLQSVAGFVEAENTRVFAPPLLHTIGSHLYVRDEKSLNAPMLRSMNGHSFMHSPALSHHRHDEPKNNRHGCLIGIVATTATAIFIAAHHMATNKAPAPQQPKTPLHSVQHSPNSKLDIR